MRIFKGLPDHELAEQRKWRAIAGHTSIITIGSKLANTGLWGSNCVSQPVTETP